MISSDAEEATKDEQATASSEAPGSEPSPGQPQLDAASPERKPGEQSPDGEQKKKKSFWETLPGILTGIAGLFTAIGGLITALIAWGVLKAPPEPTPTPTSVPLTKLLVISTTPENGATDIDPALTEILVVFSQPVQPERYSLTTYNHLGEYPEMTGEPSFPEPQTCAIPVRLEPGKTYAIGINSTEHKNFVSAADASITAEPYTIVFSTAP